MKLRTCTGEKIPVVGRVTIKVQHLQQEVQLSLIVVAEEGPSLLGQDWIQVETQLEIHLQHPDPEDIAGCSGKA